MCLVLIRHWTPCLHMRGRCVDQCRINVAAPAVPSEDCAHRKDIYTSSAENEECPICIRRRLFEEHVEQQQDGMQPEVHGPMTRASETHTNSGVSVRTGRQESAEVRKGQAMADISRNFCWDE
ncbi:hypothetical protein BAUCODRAFT_266978 [Baudoinia panamericana UAMH 10762]|uniref:Uncharacterized protein n=1 Tax=Baudoinia panamericana (strain UAMH 10762) TaxID=717646 RepID=M2MNA7_BAUPA|nr:uncharacterized protein BAUCODRAFT_266978 [Baudoinia panamericana UAMH 10762]EMC92928.1 hypothetical protein BAUCODRAFT_266978 [Baudoinia panamericana UAMH 10762]